MIFLVLNWECLEEIKLSVTLNGIVVSSGKKLGQLYAGLGKLFAVCILSKELGREEGEFFSKELSLILSAIGAI